MRLNLGKFTTRYLLKNIIFFSTETENNMLCFWQKISVFALIYCVWENLKSEKTLVENVCSVLQNHHKWYKIEIKVAESVMLC